MPALLILAFMVTHALAEEWSFAVVADNRSAFASFQNVLGEIDVLRVNPEPRFPAFDFVLAVGDISPVEKNLEVYRSTLSRRSIPLLPVRGNHEDADDLIFMKKSLLPLFPQRLSFYDADGITYYTDWKNARIIVLDQYSKSARDFTAGPLLKWLRQTIKSAGKAEHIFIAYHEPYLPDSPGSDPFWRLLSEHRDKVRAVFIGHTHSYLHRRFPDEIWGIDHVNAGNAGWVSHSDRKQTVVEVAVDGACVAYRVVQAPDRTTDFRVTEEWKVKGGSDPARYRSGCGGGS